MCECVCVFALVLYLIINTTRIYHVTHNLSCYVSFNKSNNNKSCTGNETKKKYKTENEQSSTKVFVYKIYRKKTKKTKVGKSPFQQNVKQ